MIQIIFLAFTFTFFFLFSSNSKKKNKYKSFRNDNFMILTDVNIPFINKIDINDECEFIQRYSKFDINDELNIIIVCSGSDVSSSDAIISILLMHKGTINIYIPSICYSGGTMIALCADNIFMNSYSLLTPVDPQIGFSEEDDDLLPCKYYVNLKKIKGLKKLSDETIIKYYECKDLYDDNIRNMKRILEGKYSSKIKNNIIKNFGRCVYPHSKPFNIDELKKIGLEIKYPLPSYYQSIFNKFFL